MSQPVTTNSIRGEVKQTFRSLRHRNFRVYFFGMMVSLCGTWMQSLALSWLVYKMTNSPMWLGIVEFANLSPVLFFALTGGWVADRVERRTVLVVCQIVLMIQATILAYLTLTNQIQVWQIIVLALVAGTTVAFEIPSRQALIVNMVERDDFVNAVSLNSSLFNGTRVIGPALAALVIRFSSEGTCFAINAVSFSAAVLALAMLRIPHDNRDAGTKPGSIIDGLKYSFGTPEIRSVLRLTALMSLFGAQFTLLMPVISKEILHHDVEGFGVLRSAAAVGSLIAALALANRGSGEMLKRGVGVAGMCFSIALIAFGISQDFLLSAVMSLVLGFCMTFQLSGSHSLLQLAVPDALRGRLMSVWTLAILGLSPLGSLGIGALAHHFGTPTALLTAAAVGIVSTAVYLIYRK